LESTHLPLLALALTRGLGPVTVKNLIAFCGSAGAVWHSRPQKLLRAPGVGPKAVSLLKQSRNLDRARQELAFAQRQGVKVMSYLDEDYPHALKYIHNAPLFLFQKGGVDLNAQPNVAIVGTRRATAYGREMAARFAAVFAEKGLNVVSGLAYGIDIAAHKAVLLKEGITTAVLAHGLDMVYPPNHRAKAEEMTCKGGLLTEYLTGSEPDAMHFPARNRIIAGICQAVVVIEAGRTGGALITAKFAQEQNREVYALPGRLKDPCSQGCNQLIRDHGAKLVMNPQEVLDDLELVWQPDLDRNQSQQLALALEPPSIPLSDEEAKVLNYLQKGLAHFDEISLHTGIPVQRLHSLLLSMEFKELLLQMPGKRFSRK
jgi:DNA processing protein